MSDKLDVIRKLLAKAERAATEAEAEAYSAKAMALMARHGVDSAMLAASGESDDAIGGRKITMDNPYGASKAQLLGWISHALGAKYVTHTRGGRALAVTIFGWESDLDRIEMLYTSLLVQATRQLVHARPTSFYESVAAYRRSWLHGFTTRVWQRLKAAEERAREQAVAERPGTGTELVLVDRSARVERAFEDAFSDLRPGRSRKLSGSGFHDGSDAGARADLGGPRVGGRRRALA